MIFSTVTTFIEQVGRRLLWRYAELDNMICIWTGPASGALAFKPQIDSPHPQYPLMFVTDSEIVTKEGAVAELSVTYAGIFQTKGTSFYATAPIVSTSAVQGSRDFVQSWYKKQGPLQLVYADPNQYAGGVRWVQLYTAGTQTMTVRYVGARADVRYQVYPGPSRWIYAGIGESNVWYEVLSVTEGPHTTSLNGVEWDEVEKMIQGIAPIPPLYTAKLGFASEQHGRWYSCTETYGPTF
jgi:hypothetical protein